VYALPCTEEHRGIRAPDGGLLCAAFAGGCRKTGQAPIPTQRRRDDRSRASGAKGWLGGGHAGEGNWMPVPVFHEDSCASVCRVCRKRHRATVRTFGPLAATVTAKGRIFKAVVMARWPPLCEFRPRNSAMKMGAPGSWAGWVSLGAGRFGDRQRNPAGGIGGRWRVVGCRCGSAMVGPGQWISCQSPNFRRGSMQGERNSQSRGGGPGTSGATIPGSSSCCAATPGNDGDSWASVCRGLSAAETAPRHRCAATETAPGHSEALKLCVLATAANLEQTTAPVLSRLQ